MGTFNCPILGYDACIKDQSYGDTMQYVYKGSIYENTMHVQRTHPMEHDVHMYRGQSYRTVHVATHAYVYVPSLK